jgi:transcriptional regulator with XRE-family HTH domain
MDKKSFGSWLKAERQSKNMTQESLANAIGMKHSQEIAGIESGTVAFPINRISALAHALGVPKEKIFQMTLKIKENDMRKKMEEN